jgi:hypothetical protein
MKMLLYKPAANFGGVQFPPPRLISKRQMVFCATLAMVLTAELAAAQASNLVYEGYAVDGSISLPQFDPALGNLTRVAFAFHTLGEASWTFSNPTATGYIATEVMLYNDYATVFGSGASITYRGGRMVDGFRVDLPAFSSETFSNVFDVTIGGSPPGTLDIYTGNGNVTFTQGAASVTHAVRLLVMGSPSQINFDSYVNISSSHLMVQYTYEVPEPAAFIFVGIGVAGLVFFRRCKQEGRLKWCMVLC